MRVVKLDEQEVDFLSHVLDQWEPEEDTELAESVYAKLHPHGLQHDPGQLTMDIEDGSLIISNG